MRRTSKVLALGNMLGSLVFASGALAQDRSEVDLTGTWEGTQICEELIGGEVVNTVIVDNPLLVVQDRGTFRFLYIGESEEEIADDLLYEGVIKLSRAAITSKRWLASVAATTKPRRSSGCGGSKPRKLPPTSMPIPSSSPMTFRRSGELSTSRRSGPTCRSASDQASARPNDEGDGPPIPGRCSAPDLWRYVAPPEITSGGFRASRRSGEALESAVRSTGRPCRSPEGRSSCGGAGRPGPTRLVSVLGRAGTRL
jgi:hypothetical protein